LRETFSVTLFTVRFDKGLTQRREAAKEGEVEEEDRKMGGRKMTNERDGACGRTSKIKIRMFKET
jgi:hypothetical protein